MLRRSIKGKKKITMGKLNAHASQIISSELLKLGFPQSVLFLLTSSFFSLYLSFI